GDGLLRGCEDSERAIIGVEGFDTERAAIEQKADQLPAIKNRLQSVACSSSFRARSAQIRAASGLACDRRSGARSLSAAHASPGPALLPFRVIGNRDAFPLRREPGHDRAVRSVQDAAA